MLSLLALAVAVQQPAPIDLSLLWKPGDKLVYVHRTQSKFASIDVTGTVTLAVTAADKEGVTLTNTEVAYTSTGTRMNNLPAATVKLSPKGYILTKENVPALVLYLGMNLPKSPVKPGDTYKVSFPMPGPEGTFDLTGKYEGLQSTAPEQVSILAKLTLNGVLKGGGQSFPVSVEQIFDTKHGVFVSVSMSMEGISSTSITLKP